MVETILDVCAGNGLNARYGTEVGRPDEPTSWVADISRTTALTGWRPQNDLRSGVERMWSWFQDLSVRETMNPRSPSLAAKHELSNR
jgi:nucleoside-diphosphate-sugar epimerase